MKANIGSKTVDLSPSTRSTPRSHSHQKASVQAPVSKGFRPSFTPNIFSSFEQFDLTLRSVAARADSAYRKRKPLVSTPG